MKKNIGVFFIVAMVLFVVCPVVTTENLDADITEKTMTESEKTMQREWTIVEYFPIPEDVSGLAYDGSYLYCGIYGANGDEIYQIDPATGAYSLLCHGPQDKTYGLTYDGTYFWTTDHPSNPAVALQFDSNGDFISQFDLPDQYMSGIAYDNGDFWVATYYPDPAVIYRVNSTGAVQQSFQAPDNQPWDLCIQDDALWMVDRWGDAIYKINTTDGSLLETYDSQGTDPAGVVWDGQYLWYCDEGEGGVDYLYKVDLNGSGTPEIQVSSTSHDFGSVAVGDSETWNVTVENLGNGDLIITDVTFWGDGSCGLSCPLTFPVTVTPGNQTKIPIVFGPINPGPLNATATIWSNDPMNPEVDILLTGYGVNLGPDIDLPEDSHDYGTVRVHSYNRWVMEIQNRGNATLIITSITSSDPCFIVDVDVTFPLDVPTLTSVFIPIWFQPAQNISYMASLSINSNDPDENPYIVSLQGAGVDTLYPIGTTLWYYHITDPSDSSPKAITSIPDINGDGVADVIIASEDDYIRCFNGNDDAEGTVLWEHEIYSGSLYHQNELTITEDIDGDGYQDVVIGTPWGDRSIYTLSGKTGEVIWKHDTHEYGDGGWVYQVDCSYDYNNDGMVDVLAATGDDADDTGPKRVYCLDAYTGDSIWECYLAGPGFSVIGVEDFTGDGQPDVIAGAANDLETEGKVYGINGATGGIMWMFTTFGSSVWALAQIDDISGDGIPDVLAGDFSGYFYGLNVVNGNQVYGYSMGTVIILRFETLGDVNGDGHPDVLPAHSGSTARVINPMTGGFVWSHPLADKSWCVARSSDISGDGIDDVFIGTLYTNNMCYFLNGTDGSELAAVTMNYPVDALAAIPDITEDGSMEMVAGLRNGDVIVLSGGLHAAQMEHDVHITSLREKWNMVSIPFNQSFNKTAVIVEYAGENYTWTEAVGMGLISDYIFGWNRSAQSYLFSDTFEPGYGYWVYAFVACDLWAENITIMEDDYITKVKAKWNIIGVPDEQPVNKTMVTVIYAGSSYTWDEAVGLGLISDFVFGWDAAGQTYTFADEFLPGEGYWMYAYQECVLTS